MNPPVASTSLRLLVALGVSLWAACSSKTESQPDGTDGGGSASGSSSGADAAPASTGPSEATAGGGNSRGGMGSSSGGAVPVGGGPGSSSGGMAQGGAMGSEAGSPGPTTGAGSSSGSGSGSGVDSGKPGGSSGVSTSGGSSGAAVDAGPGSGGRDAGPLPSGCTLPATVSFQKDVQPFLSTACGGGNGCHVIDNASTTAAGGYDHAYDWVTGLSHASSCPETPTPLRFQVVVATINQANAPTCSKSRKMPPPDATGAGVRTPLTPCQIATLQAWLGEPLVTQMHRADGISPTTPYAMPPFN